MVCRKWSQPDADHWRGLCTNELYAEGDAQTCIVCATPIQARVSSCGCNAPKLPRGLFYLRVAYIGSPPIGSECVVNAPIGDFILIGTCGAKTREDQITVNVLAPVGTPTCTGYAEIVPDESRVKRYSFITNGSPYVGGDGRTLRSIILTYSQRGAVWTGPTPPEYNQSFSYVWDGDIPWCDDSRGSVTLLQRGTTENPSFPGIFPPSIRAIISTEPFE